jgi:hypothetical protein
MIRMMIAVMPNYHQKAQRAVKRHFIGTILAVLGNSHKQLAVPKSKML